MQTACTPVFHARVGIMPLKFFLKLYARLAGLTALVVLLCALLFTGINSVRSQFWHERFPEPVMRWLAATPAPAQQYHWLRSTVDFRVGAASEFVLSQVALERLGYGQVVGIESGAGYRVLIAGLSGQVLQLRLTDPYRDVAETTGLIFRWHLDSAPPENRPDVAAQMARVLNVGVRPLDDSTLLPGSDVLGQVADRGLAFYTEGSDDSGRVIIQLSDGELFRIDMPAPFSAWSWPVVLLLVMVLGGVLAVALFLALREVDNNLRTVESVAVRIARGEMGARVQAGEGTLVSRLAASFNGMAEHIQRLVQGQREVTVPNSVIRYSTSEDGGDYLFLHLMEPHANSEEYTDSILDVIKQFGVKRYCRLGAMYDAVPHTRPLLVTGTLGDVPQIKEVSNFKIRRSTYQGPTTIMNLVSEGIEKMGVETINFMVHLPQYLQLEEDYTGTSRMIEVLSSVYANIPSDLAPIRRGQRQYRELSSAVERNSELKQLIQQMEAYYDAQLDAEDNKPDEPAPLVDLSPEIEQFLSELGQRMDTEE